MLADLATPKPSWPIQGARADRLHPARIIATLRDALPPASCLALSHGTADFHPPGTVGQAAAVYDKASAPLVLRSHANIAAFFGGFDLVEPGWCRRRYGGRTAGRPGRKT